MNTQAVSLKTSVEKGHLYWDMPLGNTQYALRSAAI